jgi:hypothetical protein
LSNSMLTRRNWRPREAGVAAEEPFNLLHAFLGFELAGAVDPHSAGCHESSGVVQQA